MRKLFLLAVAAMLMSSVAAHAHHSYAATYDTTKEVKLSGKLIQFSLKNPHSYVTIQAPDAKGAMQRWSIEWSGTSQLSSKGITNDTLKIGDQVNIVGRPSRVPGEFKALMVSLKRPSDGFTWGQPVKSSNKAAAALLFVALSMNVVSQQRGGAPAAGRGGGAQQTAPIDLTGYWVSVLTEDWEFRMVTPRKGVYDTLNLNAEGRRVGDTWDPAKDEAAGEQCRAYGAGNIMRMPTRLHITWENANALKVETDAGTQTRLFRFGVAPTAAPAGEPSWQGNAVAEWETAAAARGANATRNGNLKVVTTNLRMGYIRRNGAPYSKNAVITEYYDLFSMPNGDRWLTITTKIDDPTYFSRPYITTSDFKKLPDAAGWNPTACSAR